MSSVEHDLAVLRAHLRLVDTRLRRLADLHTGRAEGRCPECGHSAPCRTQRLLDGDDVVIA